MPINTSNPPSGGGRNIPLSSLRTCLTLMVVAHHAALAYHAYAPPPAQTLAAIPPTWLVFPIVDPQRWAGAALLVGFNDMFFMSLMFLISGIFAWPSLVRRGAGGFARERALKLGVPFIVSAVLLAPLAYYATYVATGADPNPLSFVQQWLALRMWPAGPAWFLWLLLAFGLVAAAGFALAPSWGARLGELTGRWSRTSAVYVGVLMAASALTYLPMAAIFSPEAWTTVGPLAVQTSRLLHYAVYFLAGAGLGAYGVGRGLLAEDGELARRWLIWVAASLVAFGVAIIMLLVILSTLDKGGPGAVLSALGNLSFVLSCACSSVAFLSLFLRFSRTASTWWASLGANAYGIYLAHYFCVTWLQLSLVSSSLPGVAKFFVVFVCATSLAWGLSAALRRIPAVAHVV